MIYLDHNATTPLDSEVLCIMHQVLQDTLGNPSSMHCWGRKARAWIDESRERLAAVLQVRPHEVIFTSGGTESNNLAILGLARSQQALGKHLITSAIEHHAVLHAFEYLVQAEGYAVTILPVDRWGQVAVDDLRQALRPDTTLVSILSANNETGVLQPLKDLVAVCQERGVKIHSDLIQSFGKEPSIPGHLGLQAFSLAAHKFYGPPGVGALYLQAGSSLTPLHHGGAHENQRRPGTENVAAIVGMAVAAERVMQNSSQGALKLEQARQSVLRELLWSGIQKLAVQIPLKHAPIRNGHPEACVANTLNVSFPGISGEALLIGLDLEGVGVSNGAACMVGSIQPSHVLQAMGVAPEVAKSTIRFSLGKGNTEADIHQALAALRKVLQRQ